MSEHDQESEETSHEDIKGNFASKLQSNPQLVKWEMREGNLYAVLFDRVLEIYSV